MVDDLCKTSLPPAQHPGPQATLSRSEGVTLAICGQWQEFGSARGFSRSAQRHLRAALPQLPTREQDNRQVRQYHDTLAAFIEKEEQWKFAWCAHKSLERRHECRYHWRHTHSELNRLKAV